MASRQFIAKLVHLFHRYRYGIGACWQERHAVSHRLTCRWSLQTFAGECRYDFTYSFALALRKALGRREDVIIIASVVRIVLHLITHQTSSIKHHICELVA